MTEESKAVIRVKRRRVGDPPDPQLLQFKSSPLRLPTAISTLVFSFLPFLESLPEVEEETKIAVADVRGNTKLVCKEMKRRVQIALKENKVDILLFDKTWGPIVAMNGLHSVALALAEQIDAAKVRAWIVNDCGLALDSARDVDMFVGRFRNLRIFSFTARLSNLAGRRGRDSFQSILNLRTLEQFEMDLHNDPQWMMRSTFYGDIARSRAPLVRLKLQGLNKLDTQPPRMLPLATWERMEHLTELCLDVALHDDNTVNALANCRVLEKLELSFHAWRDIGDVNRLVMDIANVLAEGKNPLREVSIGVASYEQEVTQPNRPFVPHASALSAWLAFKNMQDFRLAYSANLARVFKDEAEPTIQSVIVRMLGEWKSLQQLTVEHDMTASFLVDTFSLAPTCEIVDLYMGGDSSDVSSLVLWHGTHPRSFATHRDERYSVADIKSMSEDHWRLFGVHLIGNDVAIRFVTPLSFSSFAAAMFAGASPVSNFTIVGEPVGELKSALRIDDALDLTWTDLPPSLYLVGTLALTAAFST